MNSFIAASLPSSFTEDEDHLLSTVALHTAIVLQHQGAIAYLVAHGQFDGSALALLRPLAETASRAHWLYSCGNKNDIARIRAGKKLKTIWQGKRVDLTFKMMAEQAENKLRTGGLISSVVPFITILHELTHGGLAQLIRNVDVEGNNIRPNYSEDDRIKALGSATAQLTVLAIAYCKLIARGKPETASKQISDRFVSLYPLVTPIALKGSPDRIPRTSKMRPIS